MVCITGEKIPANTELGFLYKTCNKIRPVAISLLAYVSEYVDAIKSYKGFINDKSVYLIVRNAFVKMLESGKNDHYAKVVINLISKDVMGSSDAWKVDISPETLKVLNKKIEERNKKNELKFLEKAGDFFYLKDVLNLKLSSLNSMFSYEEFIDAFRKHGAISSDKEAFEVFKSVFYPMIRAGMKNNPEQKHKYYQLRNVLRDFSAIIFGDADAWHEDYSNFYNT